MNPLFEELKEVFGGKYFLLKNPYMINRILTFHPKTFNIAKQCNKYIGRIPNDILMKVYINNIKENRTPFILYPKEIKASEKKLVSNVCRFFCCRPFHAKQIIMIYRKMGESPESFFGLKTGE